jgi:outer membrane receptor protein involved in Fe transport
LAQDRPAANAPSADATADIIVTASKRNESVRSLAASVTALTGDQLNKIGAQSFKDYLAGLPGVQFQQATPGVSNVTMRGVGTATIYPDQGQATTGIYINDIPVTDPGFALSVPDLDVFDVQRVEVLKGPQGTLFGSATLGGAVNYIYNPVSLTEVQAKAQAGIYGVESGGGLGYTVKGAVNVPIVDDRFGVRVAVVRRSDPGYLDNVGTGEKNTNTHHVTAVRGNALLKLTDDFKLSYFFLYDRAHNGDGFYSFPEEGKLVRDTEYNETATFTNRVHNLKLDGDLGFASLLVSLADLRKTQTGTYDNTPYYDGPTYGVNDAHNHSQIAEIRLTSKSGQRFEWLVGGYFGRTTEFYPSPAYVGNGDLIDYFAVNYKSHEKSAFGEATYHLTDTLKVTVGGRYYDIGLSTKTTAGLAPDVSTSGGRQTGNGFSPKASITYQPSKDVMVYASASKGFRMGGVNLNPQIASFPTPATYGSDSVWNYEIGTRLSLFDRKLLIDSTAFFIDWTGIQLRLSRPDGRAYVANAGKAHNYGIENAVTWRPSSRFDVQANFTYLSAKLAETLVLGNGTTLPKGYTLPGAARWTTSENATYHFDLPHAPYVTAQHQYISRSTDNFDPTLKVGKYSTFALRAGAEFGKFNVQAYVTNLTDKRGAATSDFFGASPVTFYIQPRTAGISVDWSL